MRRLALLALLASCASLSTPRNAKAPDEGVTIAFYANGSDGYAVIDDRRWVAIDSTSILLANIDPGAELASLVIEPFDRALAIGQCVRDRLPDVEPVDPLEEYAAVQRERRARELRRRIEGTLGSRTLEPDPEPAQPRRADGERFMPIVKCDVRAKPGRYLVRVLYVTKSLGYRAQHDIDVSDDKRARVASRFAIATPVWQQRAAVTLYDGLPGGEHTPREVARGQLTLDGSTAVLAVPVREVGYELRRVYEGAVITGEDSNDVMWGHDSVQAVWMWLELDGLRLAQGPVRVHLDVAGEGVRDLDVPATARKQSDRAAAPLRLPLWIDESLRGSRQRIIEYNDGAALEERYVFGVANTGDTVREVWVEERLRRAMRRRIDRAWPKKPAAEDNVLRTKLVIKPGRIERTGYTLTYEF